MNTTTRAMNPADTTLAPTLCCYEGCDAVATVTDDDGDDCCVECAAKQESWVVVTDLSEDARWCDAGLAEEVEEAMAELGYDVEIREPRRGEIEGTFAKNQRGELVSVRHLNSKIAERFRFDFDREHDKLI